LIAIKISFAEYYAEKILCPLSLEKKEADLQKGNIKEKANFAVVFLGPSLPSPVSWNKQALPATQR
jgi:hypothetical protein